MSSNPSCDLARFSKLWALGMVRDRAAPDYTFSFSRGPQLTTMDVVVRTTPPGPIALRGAGIINARETAVYRELDPENDMTFAGKDGEEGNDDYEPGGYEPHALTEYRVEHHDEPTPLLEGTPKTAGSIEDAAVKSYEFGGYSKQQAIAMVSHLCLGTPFPAGDIARRVVIRINLIERTR